MSITASELVAFGCLNHASTSQGPVLDDVSTVGGDIDLAWVPSFTQIAQSAGSAAKVKAYSSSASDNGFKVVVKGRDFTGAIQTDTITLTGTTGSGGAVLGSIQFERIQQVYVTNSGGTKTVPNGTVTVTDNAGTPNTLGTIGGAAPFNNQYGFYMLFENSASDPSSGKTRYELIYFKNTDASLTLTSSYVTLSADASGKLQIAVANATGSAGTVSNRLTAPSVSDTFAGVGSTQHSVPGGNLASGAYIGVWVKQVLSAGDAAQKNNFTTTLNGQTT